MTFLPDSTGFYTYFATDGFTYGSSNDNWKTLSAFANENNLIFIPCAGPGYADLRIRPWNTANQRSRENGEYYRRMLNSALDAAPPFVGITSFNEWHEGTQIEPAVPKSIEGFTYQDHSGIDYLKLTSEIIDSCKEKTNPAP